MLNCYNEKIAHEPIEAGQWIYMSETLVIIGSDKGLSLALAIIWDNADLLSIGSVGTSFKEI